MVLFEFFVLGRLRITVTLADLIVASILPMTLLTNHGEKVCEGDPKMSWQHLAKTGKNF